MQTVLRALDYLWGRRAYTCYASAHTHTHRATCTVLNFRITFIWIHSFDPLFLLLCLHCNHFKTIKSALNLIRSRKIRNKSKTNKITTNYTNYFYILSIFTPWLSSLFIAIPDESLSCVQCNLHKLFRQYELQSTKRNIIAKPRKQCKCVNK